MLCFKLIVLVSLMGLVTLSQANIFGDCVDEVGKAPKEIDAEDSVAEVPKGVPEAPGADVPKGVPDKEVPGAELPKGGPTGAENPTGHLPLDCLGDFDKTMAGPFEKYDGQKQGITFIILAIIKDLLKLNEPGKVDDIAALIYKLGYVIQKLFDGLSPGFGSALNKIISGIAYIVLCDLGYKGLTGKLLGGEQGIAAPKDTAKICKKGFAPGLGLGGNMKCDEVKNVIDEGESECKQNMKKINGGKGPSGKKGFLNTALEAIISIVGLGGKCKDKDHDIDLIDLTNILKSVLTIFGGCGNHYGDDLGNQLLGHMGKVLGGTFGKHGFDPTAIQDRIGCCKAGKGLEELCLKQLK